MTDEHVIMDDKSGEMIAAVRSLGECDPECFSMNHPGGWTCSEADALYEIVRLAWDEATANYFMAGHAEGDEPCDSHIVDEDDDRGWREHDPEED